MAEKSTVPSPSGSKCRVNTCTSQVGANHLYCSFCWTWLPISYKTELIDSFEPGTKLISQCQAFLQARIKADRWLNQTLYLKDSQDKKKTG